MKESLLEIAEILSGLDVGDATDIEMRIFKILEREGVAKIEEVSYDGGSYSVFSSSGVLNG